MRGVMGKTAALLSASTCAVAAWPPWTRPGRRRRRRRRPERRCSRPEEYQQPQLREAEEAAAPLGVTLVVVAVRSAGYASAFDRIVSERAQALLVFSSPLLHRDRSRILELAAKHRLPAIYQWREYAEEGGLMAFGSNLAGLSRHMASYVDRIFKGARPAELPVEQPTVYELVINLKTAKTLGLTIPVSLVARVDQVIE
jgi:putative ABC transport system substrate-binding protein